MPGRSPHADGARSFEELARFLRDTQWPSWAVVSAFYSALHWVDCYLASRDIHPGSHDERERYISRERELRQIYVQYRMLRQRSEAARYNLRQFSPPEVDGLIESELGDVRRHLAP